MEVKRKRLKVIVNIGSGNVVVHDGYFDPNCADTYIVYISPHKARRSLIVQEVKRSVRCYEDCISKQFNKVPKGLKKKLSKYLPFDAWEFHNLLETLRKDVLQRWKI